MHHVAGGDREVPTGRVVYDEPKPKPKGLDWSKHTAPAPPRLSEPERAEPTVQEIKTRLKRAPKPRPPRQPRERKPLPNCECGKPKGRYSTQCRECYDAAHPPRPPRPPREPKPPAVPTLCECGKPRSPSATRCRECHIADRGPTRTSVVDVALARREYLDGDTVPTIAERHGWPVVSVRRQLAKAGVPMRDDRRGHSGSTKKEYDPQLVAQVRDLYESGLSQSSVADRLGLTTKIVQTIMGRYGIEARQRECGRGDTLGEYRRRLTELGVTATFIRSWALAEGIKLHPRAMPPMAVIEAYARSRAAA